MKLYKSITILIILLGILISIVACRFDAEAEAVEACTAEPPTVAHGGLIEQVQIAPRYTEADVEAMAVMLAGECYIWDTADMRNAAITVCNRVDSSMWTQNTVTAVIQQTGYYGYDAHNTPQEVHYNVALQVLTAWSARSQGYELPWEPWLFFSAVNGKNEYRVNY